MKHTFNLLAIILISGLFLFSGCKKKDDTPTTNVEQEQRNRLQKTWVPQTPVLFDNAPDPRFQAFEVTFNANNQYSSLSGAPVFRANANGNWAFKPNSNFTVIVLDNGPEFVITSLTDTSLQGTVNLQGANNGRTTGIDGVYTFNLRVK